MVTTSAQTMSLAIGGGTTRWDRSDERGIGLDGCSVTHKHRTLWPWEVAVAVNGSQMATPDESKR